MTPNRISWCVGPDGAPGFSWNPTGGCGPVSAGCAHCWASLLASTRLAHLPEYAGLAKDGIWLGHARFFADRLAEPLRRKKPAGIVVSLMGDLFHSKITDSQIFQVWQTMCATPWHRYYVLTKRPRRTRSFLEMVDPMGVHVENDLPGRWPLPNGWLGVSIEDRASLPRVDDLRATPAAVRYLSIEPLLEDLGRIDLSGISWVIVGGESGPAARPCHVQWIRSIMDQCKAAGVACFVKQLGATCQERNDAGFDGGDGEWPSGTRTLGGERYQGAPTLLNLHDRAGAEPDEWPEDLRVRQMPGRKT